MTKQSFCKCHWSRQVSTMRHCWNKLFFMIIRVMVIINQLILMSPFIYFKNSKGKILKKNFPARLAVTWKFRTHRLVTAMSIFLFIFYAAASPFMVKMASDLYSTTRRHQDNLFILIAKFTMTIDVVCSLLVLATHIWRRADIVKILNFCNEILLSTEQLEKNFVDIKILLALVLKLALTIYDLVLSLPYLFSAAPRLNTQSIVAYLFTHYLQGLGSIFELNVFIFILLFLTCSLQLEKALRSGHITASDLKICQLINLQNSLQQLIVLFRNTFQFGIFFTILLYFVTILCNIYAMLDFYVTTHHFYSTFITYLLCLILELYSLICVTYLCDRSQREIKDLFLLREELYFLKPSKSLSIVEMDILWPQLSEFQLLGIYTLNNEFALFLLTYSINFILIILEFEINKARK